MDKARARIVGDMIAGEDGDVIIPFAVCTVEATVGVGKLETPSDLLCR